MERETDQAIRNRQDHERRVENRIRQARMGSIPVDEKFVNWVEEEGIATKEELVEAGFVTSEDTSETTEETSKSDTPETTEETSKSDTPETTEDTSKSDTPETTEESSKSDTPDKTSRAPKTPPKK